MPTEPKSWNDTTSHGIQHRMDKWPLHFIRPWATVVFVTDKVTTSHDHKENLVKTSEDRNQHSPQQLSHNHAHMYQVALGCSRGKGNELVLWCFAPPLTCASKTCETTRGRSLLLEKYLAQLERRLHILEAQIILAILTARPTPDPSVLQFRMTEPDLLLQLTPLIDRCWPGDRLELFSGVGLISV